MAVYMDKDILVNIERIDGAISDLTTLKSRTETLEQTAINLYNGVADALDSDAGQELQYEGAEDVVKPISNLALVIGEMISVLEEVKGSGYYQTMFDEFLTLNGKIKFK